MSQSLRTPKSIAIRAVAAAALYASRNNGQQAEEGGAVARAPDKKPVVQPGKPAPKA